MEYRSVVDLNRQITRWLPDLPKDLDLIVGVPRSGLLPATLLSLYLNLPLTDVDGLIEGRLLGKGARNRGKWAAFPDKGRVLVVDDSVLEGHQMREIKRRLSEAKLGHSVQYAAVYVEPGMERSVDFFSERVSFPRVFEWNVMHHGLLYNVCMDIDGVLCRDPSREENDDGAAYEEFLCSVDPAYIPSRPVGWLVTCRLDKYRAQTERWMAERGIEYGELVMMDYASADARTAADRSAAYKAEVYLKTGAFLFIESSLSLAIAIATLSGKSVYCTDTREMIQPGAMPLFRRVLGEAPGNTRRHVRQFTAAMKGRLRRLRAAARQTVMDVPSEQ